MACVEYKDLLKIIKPIKPIPESEDIWEVGFSDVDVRDHGVMRNATVQPLHLLGPLFNLKFD